MIDDDYILGWFNDHVCNVSQLEDVEVTVADHMQKVIKPNFGAFWEEIGESNEVEDTFALSSSKSLEGSSVYFLQLI